MQSADDGAGNPELNTIELSRDHMVIIPRSRIDGRALSILWLPYQGPGVRQPPQRTGGPSDADYAAALQKLSTTRYQGLMDAAWSIGGWSTYRHR